MKYKTVYMTHDVSSLIANTKGKMGKSTPVCEISDWDDALNEYAEDGWIVKKCGTIVASNDIIFWALLKKIEKQMDI